MAFEFNKPNRAEINRLNHAISAEEQTINGLFQKIGQTYYANHRNDPEENQAESIRGILEALERAKGYKEQINTLRGITICPNCKAEVSINSAFCNHCGTKLSTPVQPAAPVDQSTVVCQSCGNRCNAGQRFCNQCGTPLSQPAPAYKPIPVPVYEPTPAPSFEPAPTPSYEPIPAPSYEQAPTPSYEPIPAPVYEPAPVPSDEPLAPEEPTPINAPADEPVTEPAPMVEPVSAAEIPEAEPAPVEEPAAPQTKICPNCGTVLEADCNFCLECGAKQL